MQNRRNHGKKMNRFLQHVVRNCIVLVVLTIGLTWQLNGQRVVKPANTIPSDFCISPMEMKLYRMINDYRKKFNLPPIPLSRSLSYVASCHVKDLLLNPPEEESCNFHSWSGNGPWKQFCYPRDENKKNSVWDKPKEFTTYKGKGYEIVYWENNSVVIDSVISFWKSIPYFKSFLMNNGKWQGKTWKAIGIGIFENFACAWFGELSDQEGPPAVCGIYKEQIPTDSSKSKLVKENSAAISKADIKISKTASKDSATTGTLLTKPERIDGINGKVYVIVKSQIPLAEARQLLPGIRKKGFQDAKIIILGNKVRISVFESVRKTEAENKLREVKKVYKDAWLLKN